MVTEALRHIRTCAAGQVRTLSTLATVVLALVLARQPALGQEEVTSSDRYALLVGISAYAEGDGADQVRPLAGPKNDVTLLYHTLVELGVPAGQIRVVADSLDAADYERRIEADAEPTRAEILAGIDWVIETARAGDEVLIYVAGHGSNVPEAAKEAGSTEIDGLDEIILPIDIGVWQYDAEQVENQILDDEFGERIGALVESGVFVWFVVDTCHSGTAIRSDGVARRVDPAAALGVPAERLDRAGEARARRGDGEALAPPQPSVELRGGEGGGFVAFYAAQPDELAIEGPMPKTAAADQRRQHGLITWNIVQALRSGDAPTYEAIARRVLAGYWEWGGRAPVPMFDGDLARAPFVGGGGDRSWGMEARDGNLIVRGGLLDDIAPGTVFAVGQPAAEAGEPLFYARVVDAGVETAEIEILPSTAERPARLDEILVERGLRPGHRQVWLEDRAPTFEARLVERIPAFTLTIARPGDLWRDHPDPDVARLRTVLRELAAALPDRQPLALAFVDREPADAEGPAADLVLEVHDGRLWFRPTGTELVTEGQGQAYSLPLSSLDFATMADALRVIARARNLARVAELYADSDLADGLRVEVNLLPSIPDSRGPCPQPEEREASTVPAEAMSVNALGYGPVDVLPIGHCDRVFISVTNTGDEVLDLTPLYIGPWSQIYFLDGFEDAAFGGLRLWPAETRIVSYTEDTFMPPDGVLVPTGFGRVVLLAVEGDPRRPFAADFRHLTGRLPVSQRRDAAAPSALRALLDAAAFGDGRVRSAPEGAAAARAGAVSIFFESRPPQG